MSELRKAETAASKLIGIMFRVTEEEWEQIARKAGKRKLSMNNYVRKYFGFPTVKHGGAREAPSAQVKRKKVTA